MWMKKRMKLECSKWPSIMWTALHILISKPHNNMFYEWGNNSSGRFSDFIRD